MIELRNYQNRLMTTIIDPKSVAAVFPRSWDNKEDRTVFVHLYLKGVAKPLEGVLDEIVFQRLKHDFSYSDYLPAKDGYKILTYWSGWSDRSGFWEEIDEEPVLTWRFDSFGFHRAIGLLHSHVEYADSDDTAILCPNGTVVVPGLQQWDSRSEWAAERRESHRPKGVPLTFDATKVEPQS